MRKRFMVFMLSLFSLSICFGTPQIVQSAPILDQQYTPEPGYAFMYAELDYDLVRAQTFTVGLSGLLSGFYYLFPCQLWPSPISLLIAMIS